MTKTLARATDYLSIFKPRIVALLVIVALATAVVNMGGQIAYGRLAWLALAGAMASAGASVLNNCIDGDIDGVMGRTRSRPLPNRRFDRKKAAWMGFVLLALSAAAAVRLGYVVAVFVLSGAAVYVVLYTLWLKRRSQANIIVGGLSGSCAVLAGWFSAGDQVTLTPVLIALLLFLWTPGHFWSFAMVHRESYRQAGIPMLPVVAGERKTAWNILLYSSLVILVSGFIYFSVPFGRIYLAGVLALAGAFLATNLRLWLKPERSRAWSNYKLSGIYLLGLFVAMTLDVIVR